MGPDNRSLLAIKNLSVSFFSDQGEVRAVRDVSLTISAGQTWNFQCWYRDALSPCGITNNLSNGLSVDFTP